MTTEPEERREQLYHLLGDLPDRHHPISVSTVSQEDRESYVLEKLMLDLNGIEPVPAYFIKPKEPGPGKLPVIVYNHSHGGRGEVGTKHGIGPLGKLGDQA